MRTHTCISIVYFQKCIYTIKDNYSYLKPVEKENGFQRTCANVMKVFKWIRCDMDGDFASLQCDPHMGRCFCLRHDGTRMNRMTMSMNTSSMDMNNICNQCKFLDNPIIA